MIITETQAAFVKGRLISDNIFVAHEALHALRTRDQVSSEFLAVRTDMMKAYDRLEWPFVEQSLRCLGFCERWIHRIMVCISSVSYGILINGRPYGRITPSRGIRQGDPLSPFIFILCAEILANTFRVAAEERKLTGLQIAPGAPSLSHLLFADDSLFSARLRKSRLSI